MTHVIGGNVMKSEVKTVKKRIYHMRITKWRLLAFFLISGYLQFPLYVSYSVNNPVRATELASKVSFGLFNAWLDVREVAHKTYEIATPKYVRNKVSRYQLPAHASFMTEATGIKQVPWYHRALQKINPMRLITK